jgi:(3S)-malyl-CoA thioesterase
MRQAKSHDQLTLCPRSALYLPASNARAIEKARTLAADMIMLDLEDAVPADKKEEARAAAVAAMEAGFGERMAAIAAVDGVVGLFAGINDLKNELHLPDAAGRDQVSLSLQMMVIAARAAGKWVLDSVYNELSNAAGLEAECVHGRLLGFDGKTLIHPNQIEAANRIWSPSEAEIADARAIIEAGKGGAVRMGERMVESMHVEAAKRLLAQARLTA